MTVFCRLWGRRWIPRFQGIWSVIAISANSPLWMLGDRAQTGTLQSPNLGGEEPIHVRIREPSQRIDLDVLDLCVYVSISIEIV